jgi:hypothetical protein
MPILTIFGEWNVTILPTGKTLLGLGFVATAVLLGPALGAAEIGSLYDAQTIVTGTEEPERTRGLRAALLDVIIKLTGDARLEQGGRLKPLLDHPHPLVDRFEYEDRMKDLPVRDEQGTRERPHYLRVHFKPAGIDAALKRLGLEKWSSNRPVVAIWLGIRTARGSRVLAAEGSEAYGQRIVLTETAARHGLPIVLPPAGQTAVTYADISSKRISKVKAASPHADAHLVGTLSIISGSYWNIDWQLVHGGRSRQWTLRKVSFDAALRSGLETAALVFSGNAPN